MNTTTPKQIIRNQIYIILGKPGAWKTFFATYLASLHKRIYANYSIKFHEKEVANLIRNIDDLDNIVFSSVKGVVVIDEGWVNVNARRSSSEANMEFWQLGMLWRKKNVNIIVISQLERMTDVYFRELAWYVFTLHSWFVSGNKLMFEYSVSTWDWKIIGSKFVDLFEWSQMTGYEYDSLESGRIELESEKQKKERIEKKEKSNNSYSFE